MFNRLRALFNRVKNVYHEEGLSATIKRIFAFIISSVLSENSVLYVYERTIKISDEADRMPKIQNFTHRMIETVEQLDELANEGFDLSLIDIDQFHHRLEKGAVLSLIFIGRELGSTSWVALTEEAKNTFNRYPYKVDFANNESCGGGAWVNPKYRRQGLDNYTLYKKEQYAIGKGATKVRSVVLSSNIAGHRTSAKAGSKIVAKARYIRIFGLQFWRERPARSTDGDEKLITAKIENNDQ